MNPAMSLSEQPPRWRGRLQLLGLLAVVLGPILLATAMYYGGFWIPETRTYHGDLIGDGSSRADLGVDSGERRWQLLVTAPDACEADCRTLVYLARQIHIGLNREASRASHALAAARPLADDYKAQLDREYPQLARLSLDVDRYRERAGETPALWIVDPLGNLVMRYDARDDGRAILKDLLQLLKLSRLG